MAIANSGFHKTASHEMWGYRKSKEHGESAPKVHGKRGPLACTTATNGQALEQA